MDATPPVPPTKPDLETTPRGSWLAILLAVMAAFAFVVVFTFLTLGFVWPFVVGFAIFGDHRPAVSRLGLVVREDLPVRADQTKASGKRELSGYRPALVGFVTGRLTPPARHPT